MRQADDNISISVPTDRRDVMDTIIKIEFDRTLDNVKPIRIRSLSLVSDCRATASGGWPQPRLEARYAFDGDPDTRWGGAPDTKSGWLEVDLGKPKMFRRAWISEAYDRIGKFELQIQKDGDWQTFYTGTTIGEDFSAAFEPITAQHIRLNILDATDVPTIWEIQLFDK